VSELEQVIQAIKSLHYEALHQLLDSNNTYSDVTKELFISRLQEELELRKLVTPFEKVIEGVCRSCNKGCKAYKFKSEGHLSLNLFIEIKNEKVKDIYLCNKLVTGENDYYETVIYFEFHEDEKVDFKPTLEHLINCQKVEVAVNEFNEMALMGLIPIQEVEYWYNKLTPLADELEFTEIFVDKSYKAFEKIKTYYNIVKEVVENYTNRHIAIEGLKEFHSIDLDDEKNMIAWLLKYDDNPFHFLNESSELRKIGILVLETKPQLVIDCTDFKESFIFFDIYSKNFGEMIYKYEPVNLLDENGKKIEFSLQNYLKSHNKYLDLL